MIHVDGQCVEHMLREQARDKATPREERTKRGRGERKRRQWHSERLNPYLTRRRGSIFQPVCRLAAADAVVCNLEIKEIHGKSAGKSSGK